MPEQNASRYDMHISCPKGGLGGGAMVPKMAEPQVTGDRDLPLFSPCLLHPVWPAWQTQREHAGSLAPVIVGSKGNSIFPTFQKADKWRSAVPISIAEHTLATGLPSECKHLLHISKSMLAS